MTTSFVAVASAESNTLAMPSHQAGDLLLLFVFRNTSSTAITAPSGWFPVGTRTANSKASGVYGKVASSGVETSGTWTNAEFIACAVYRDNLNYLLPGENSSGGGAATTTIAYNALTTSMRGTHYVAGFVAGSVNNSDINTAPTGMMTRGSLAGASVAEIAVHDTNGNVSSWATTNYTASVSQTFHSYVVELWDTGIAKSSGSGLSPSLINSQALVRGIVI